MAEYLRVNSENVAVEAWTAPEDLVPADLFHPDLAALFHPKRNADIGWIWKNGAFVPPAGENAPPPVPDVSSAQAKIQLLRAKFLPAVKDTIAAIGGEIEIWFNDARTWQRSNPHVNDIGAGLGLTSDEIDELFRDAAKIDA